ncbi:MAG: PilZ domain-containing protein, partial [Candidatus Xenobia bacterium]
EIGCRFKNAEGLQNFLRRAWAMDLSHTDQKRRTIRMEASFEVSLLDHADISARAFTRDLSFTGALLVTRTAIRPESVLVARFDFGRRGVLRTPVAVAHCRALHDDAEGSFEVGVSFLALYGAQADILSAVLGDLISKPR